jgi:hypothetical protein
MPAVERLEQLPFEPGASLPESAEVWWRTRVDPRRLTRIELLSRAYTTVYVAPFFALGALLVALEPLLFPVSILCLVHAWVIPELFANRGARVLAPEGPARPPEGGGRGLLADLLDRRPAAIEAETGAVVEHGRLGVWVIAEKGALLVRPGGRRVHAFCVGVKDPELRRPDRVAHLLLALRQDEIGFATVANHAFAGARWRIRRRLPRVRRAALDAAVAESRRLRAQRH